MVPISIKGDEILMWPVHVRLAELRMMQKKRVLTAKEQLELEQCLDANMNKAFAVSKLKNLSYIASTINDTIWQHEICQQIDKVYPYGREAL